MQEMHFKPKKKKKPKSVWFGVRGNPIIIENQFEKNESIWKKKKKNWIKQKPILQGII